MILLNNKNKSIYLLCECVFAHVILVWPSFSLMFKFGDLFLFGVVVLAFIWKHRNKSKDQIIVII